MKEYLETIEPELRVLTRLFGYDESVWAEPVRFSPMAEEIKGPDGPLYRIVFRDGAVSASRTVPVPDDPDPRLRELHRRRAVRRLCKQTLYDLLKMETGMRPPWGSMTGVRPTHLMLEALSRGMSPGEAVAYLVKDFDVTEDRARLLAEIAAVQSRLPAPGDEWMDVYIGIPFCTTRCAYCSFASGEIGTGASSRRTWSP